MPLNDPIAVYLGANDIETQGLANMLVENGIEAIAQGDTLISGNSGGMGMFPQLNRPKIYVARANASAARVILAAHDARQSTRTRDLDKRAGTIVGVTCDECGHMTPFAFTLVGTVQNCPECGEYVDVADPDGSPEDEELAREAEAASDELATDEPVEE